MTGKENAADKKIFVVLGMARSGTSVIARALKALGVELGEKLVAENSLWNPKGFWEDSDIVYKINRRILERFNHAWMSIDLVRAFDPAKVTDIKKYAIELLTQRFINTSCWGFKDPRTSQLLNFWQAAFADMHLDEHYVISLRNPLASAYSYQRVSGADIEVGLLFWLMHLIPAIEGTHHKKRVMVSYDLMLKEPAVQLERLQGKLSLPTLNYSEKTQYIHDFLDKKLQHYEYTEADLQNHSAVSVVPICIKMYAFFQKIARDEIVFDSAEFISNWQEIMREFNQVYPAYRYIDKLMKQHKQLERDMRTIKKSVPWKLIFPLRKIDDALRAMRKKARYKRRHSDAYAK